MPTFRRPDMLGRCLNALQAINHDGFSYSIVVVDNDMKQSGREVVMAAARQSPIEIAYHNEPEQNISLARNKAVANSRGDYIAFIDDDEFPEPLWLSNHFNALTKFSVDGVLGPVIPFYEGTPPEWLIKSDLCVRRSFETGTIINNAKYMRTGNVLLKRNFFDGLEAPFDPALGRTGGEDADFLERMRKTGRSFVWCNEAVVYEEVPKERQRVQYYFKRALVRGVTSADQEQVISQGTVKSLAAVTVYTLSLPFLFLAGKHLFVKYFVKDWDHIAKLCAHCGIKLARERKF
jgi:succinoglycan biosynthesis protein ExoM